MLAVKWVINCVIYPVCERNYPKSTKVAGFTNNFYIQAIHDLRMEIAPDLDSRIHYLAVRRETDVQGTRED